jgi:hypothetical protein
MPRVIAWDGSGKPIQVEEDDGEIRYVTELHKDGSVKRAESAAELDKKQKKQQTPANPILTQSVNRLTHSANPIQQIRDTWEAVKNPSPRMIAPMAGAALTLKAGAPLMAASGPLWPATGLGLLAFGATMGETANDVATGESAPTLAEQADRTAGRIAENVAGGVGGVLLPEGVNAAMKARQAAAPKLLKIADEKAVSAIDPTKHQARLIEERNPGLGATLRREGAIPWFGTPSRIQGRVKQLRADAGKKIGSLITKADKQLNDAVPEPDLVYPPPRQITMNDLKIGDRVVHKRTGGGKIVGGFGDRGGAVLEVELDAPYQPPGWERKITKQQIGQSDMRDIQWEKEPDGWTKPPVRPEKQPARPISPEQIAKELSAEIEPLRQQSVPGMRTVLKQIEEHLDDLRKNKSMSLSDAQKFRQRIDESINFNKRNVDLAGSQEFLYEIRSRINAKMDEVISGLEGMEANALKKANRTYSDLAKADQVLDMSIPRGQSNRTISLTDTIAGAAGLAHGGPAAAATVGALNKAVRTFGDPLTVRTMELLAGKQPKPKQRILNNGKPDLNPFYLYGTPAAAATDPR